MLKLLWAWATVSFSTHPECLKAPFTSIWSFETFTSSEFSQLMLQQLRQVYTKSCNYKTANNLDYVQTSRCVHIHYVQTRHCVHIHYVQTSTFFLQTWWFSITDSIGQLSFFFFKLNTTRSILGQGSLAILSIFPPKFEICLSLFAPAVDR